MTTCPDIFFSAAVENPARVLQRSCTSVTFPKSSPCFKMSPFPLVYLIKTPCFKTSQFDQCLINVFDQCFPNPSPFFKMYQLIYFHQNTTCLNLQILILISVRFSEASRNIRLTNSFSFAGTCDSHFKDLVAGLGSGVQLSHGCAALEYQ